LCSAYTQKREPGRVKREDLPYIREADARAFLDAAADLLVKEFGFTDCPRPKNGKGKQDDEVLDDDEVIGASWSDLIANIFAGRELHDSIRDLAASIIASGVNDTAAERLLHALMQASAAPHDGRWQERYDDILRAIRGARRKFGQEEEETWEDAAQPLPFIDMHKWDEELPPAREWAVLDRFPLRQAALLSGEGAAGKSIVQLHLCAAHALARDWLHTLPEPGPAMFIDAEDEAAELHRRLANILDHYSATFADVIKGGLHIMSLAGQDAVLAAPNRTGKIEPTALFKRLLQAASDFKPKMIGIASSANVYAGSEIDRAQVQQFLSLMTKLAIAANGAVVLVTHPSLTGINSDSGLSGSTAWHNSVRARAYMRSIEPEEGQQPDTDLREISFKKNNYGPVSASIVLRYQNGLFLPVPGMSSLDQAARDAKADDVFLKVLRHLSQQGQDLGPNRTASNYAPSAITKHPDAKGMRREELEAAQQRLLDANRIHITNVGPGSKRRKYLAARPAPAESGGNP
jgi:RecA-family ATPase